MSTEPPLTRYDLRFGLIGLRVRVHPMFWLVAGLLGLRLPVAEQVLWLGVVFVSVLAHEMGRALAFRAWGRRVQIVLHSLGGSTVTSGEPPGWKQLLAALSAGCAAGCLLALAAYAVFPALGSTASGPWGALRFHLLRVNVAWTALNLTPVRPLDGGEVAERLLTSASGDAGYAIGSMISLVASGILAVWAWSLGEPLLALFMGYMALKEWERSV